MNSSASLSFIHDSFVHMNKFYTKKTSTNEWFMMTGLFLTSCAAKVKIYLPELNVTVHIFVTFHVTGHKSKYDVTLGQDLQLELGINLDN